MAATGLALRGRMDAVGDAGGLPGAAPAAAAVALNIVANGVLVQAWRAVLAAAGVPLAARAAAWVWSVSQLARYAMGAAQVGGRAVAGRPYGVTATAGAVTTLVEIAWQAAITATLVLATAPWWLAEAEGLGWLAWLGVAPAVLLGVGLVRPDVLLRLVAGVLAWGPLARLTGDRLGGAVDRVHVDRGVAARLTLLYTLNSALRLAAFLCLFAAVGGGLRDDGLRAVGAYALGQLVGRLAVIVPGGIGPRESATLLAVAPAVGGGPGLVLVAAVRLAEIVGEAVFAAGARAARPARPPGMPGVRTTGGP